MTDSTASVGEWALPTAVAELVAQRPLGILTTLRRNGRPQQSVVSFAADEHQGRPRIRISVTATRAMTRNASRNPQVSLLVARPDLTSWAVLNGTAELNPVTTTPGDPAGEALAELYLAMAGASGFA